MPLKFRLVIFFTALIWNIGIYSTFLTHFTQDIFIAYPFLNLIYGHVCHQDPLKLIKLNEYFTLVCSRCAGIYFGFLTASLINLFYEIRTVIPLKIFLGILAILLFDVAATSFDIYDYSKSLAFLTGFLSASVAFSYFYNSIINFFDEIKIRK